MENSDKQLGEIMKNLFQNKEYERLLYLCQSVSPDNPNYKLSKIYEKKARFLLGNWDVKWALAFVCVALTILMSGMVYMNRKIDREFAVKEMQVVSLIDEVGAVKDENNYLKTELNKKDGFLNTSVNLLSELDEKLAAVFGDEESEIKAKLEEIKKGQNLDYNYNKEESLGVDEVYLSRPIESFLILGTHGNLTDTILLAIVNREKAETTLISIPRDLYTNGRKINSVYTLFGIDILKNQLTNITGLPLNKYVVINMEGFVELIDLLGGIEIYNEKAIYDSLYPGPNYTYTTFSLEEGNHTLDGESALKFARSRKSSSDFDRARRQQQVIDALINKMRNYDLLANFSQIQDIYNIVKKNIDTNIALGDSIGWFNEFKSFTLQKGNVLDTGNFLYSTKNVQGQYILLPNKKNFVEVRDFIKTLVLE